MTFLSPGLLWALPAVAVPILLHLLFRRPPRRLAFSHIGWLREAHRSFMPRKELKDWLLLLLRTLAVLALVLFFSRPVLQTGSAFQDGGSRETIVLMIDVSASMGAVAAGRTVLESAKESAQNLIRKLPTGARVGVVAYSNKVEQEVAPTEERARITAALGRLAPTFNNTDLSPAFQQGYAMLAAQPKSRKSIVIISDQARHGWKALLETGRRWPGYDPEVRVVIWNVAGERNNRGISSAVLELTEEGLLKGRWERHGAPMSSGDAWKLVLNGRTVDQGVAPVGLPGTVNAMKARLPEGGFFSGSLELERDAWPMDDVYYLAGRVPRGFRLLIVDGESGLSPSEAESYYLQSALESPRDPRVETIRVVRPENLSAIHWEDYGVVVLANVGSLGGREADLRQWVENGGGLLMSAGGQWPKGPESPLALFRTRSRASGSFSVNQPARGAALFSRLAQLETFEWKEIRVRDYVPVDPDSASLALLSFSNGDPLIVQKPLGRGAVLCLTTRLNRAWSNLPAKPLFAPLLREMIASLGDPFREESTLIGVVGRPLRIPLLMNLKSVTVLAPDGTATGAALGKDGALEWTGARPGLYRVQTDRADHDFSFAVNLPALDQEGDLTPVGETEARALFPGAPVEWVGEGTGGIGRMLAALQGRDVGVALLVFLVVCLLIETWLARPKFRFRLTSI